MNGDSKLLTLAALGVIGLGAAMPYWSGIQASPNNDPATSAQTTLPADFQQGFVPATDQAMWDQQVARPTAVTLTAPQSQANGLDNPAAIPDLSSQFQQPRMVEAQPIQSQLPYVPVSGVTLASGVEALESNATRREVVPIQVTSPAYNFPEMNIQAETHTVSKPVISSSKVAPATERPLPAVAPPNHSSSARQHRILDGDTLERISEKVYGHAGMADAIFRANRQVLESPALLPIGATLQMPSAEIKQDRHESVRAPITKLDGMGRTNAAYYEHEQPRTQLAPPIQPTELP